ncbi:TrkA N-terminal domain protein [Aeromicrobium marinum DSM 15272]|uniref:TrkA N-terminal domain protein n=1 Tax=Aeromicrobium marinum DSM 15272 TaxID=585531 RepID=E2SDQ4_9ACTN|nr:cation:proton antiporter family protein [Aeromicrobium marinum]EFQ82631.1 TrkA N-terminal domain protein [Aeromicrobium marinum DSM 15272]
MDLSLLLTVPLVCGLAAQAVRVPPMVGFLAAGFILNASGVRSFEALDVAADVGVTLLLFGIGLKLDPRTLVRREVWVTATVHIVVSTVVAVAMIAALGLTGLGLVAGLDWRGYALIGVALSFSSTVFVVKLLEATNSTQAFFGRTAIGVLVIQDIVAVAVLTGSTGELPSPWALSLVLVVPGAWVVRWVMGRLDHGEVQVLFGVVIALVPGYLLFDAVGLKGDLGALVLGMLLASHERSGEIRRAIFGLKEFLLVGFFVSIGFVGLPSASDLLVALLLVLLLVPLKAVGFAVLLDRTGLRHRSAALVAASLASFSEFGLIVVDNGVTSGVLEEDWLVVISTAVAFSFLASTAANTGREQLVTLAARWLPAKDPDRLLDQDRPIDVAHAQGVVIGMGRVGRSAYEQLVDEHGLEVVGVDADGERVESLREAGLQVVEGDASDPEFWMRLTAADDLDLAVLAMPFHGANRTAITRLEESGFGGVVAVVVQFADEAAQAREHGADIVLHLYDGAGQTLADDAAGAAGLGTDRPNT